MKLLFDHHLPRKLVGRLGDQFPDTSHVAFHGLSDAADIDIWAFAIREGYTIARCVKILSRGGWGELHSPQRQVPTLVICAALYIVTKDSDFNDLSALRGAPPKVIWIRIGNCTTAEVETILRRHALAIEHFLTQTADRVLEIIPFTTI